MNVEVMRYCTLSGGMRSCIFPVICSGPGFISIHSFTIPCSVFLHTTEEFIQHGDGRFTISRILLIRATEQAWCRVCARMDSPSPRRSFPGRLVREDVWDGACAFFFVSTNAFVVFIYWGLLVFEHVLGVLSDFPMWRGNKYSVSTVGLGCSFMHFDSISFCYVYECAKIKIVKTGKTPGCFCVGLWWIMCMNLEGYFIFKGFIQEKLGVISKQVIQPGWKYPSESQWWTKLQD